MTGTDLGAIWCQATGFANMVTAAELIHVMDLGTSGNYSVTTHTWNLVEQVNGAPPATGWTVRHLAVALDVALTEIKDGQSSCWIAN